VAGQVIPALKERARIVRGLIMRLDDAVPDGEDGVAEQEEVCELLIPFATQCMTFVLARSEIPPKLEVIDVARVAIAQRMLNALPTSHGLIRRHLYVEGIAASRPLLEGALLLELFQKKPERANDWFDKPLSFLSLAGIRGELGEARHDPLYSWSSEHGEHVTAAGFKLLAGVGGEGKSLELAIGGRFDARLQTEAFAVLLMSSGKACGALVDTFLRDLERLPRRGQSAFVQLMKTGQLDLPRRNAITFASRLDREGPDAKKLLAEIDDTAKAYAEEAEKLEAAGIVVPTPDTDF